jgi:MoxR-like ATPase
VIPDDVKVLAEPALAHRVIIKTASTIHDISAAHVVRELLDSTPIEAAARGAGGPREVRPSATAG